MGGRCLTTELALQTSVDPGIELQLQLVANWRDMVRNKPEAQRRGWLFWRKTYAEVAKREVRKRWRPERGPMESVMCTLLDADSVPSQQDRWESPREEALDVSPRLRRYGIFVGRTSI